MMPDDQMLSDLRAKKSAFYLDRAQNLEQYGILTYTDLFRVLQDTSADSALRSDVCWTIASLHQNIDGRKALPILLKLLHVEDRELRRAAIHTMGEWRTKRVANRMIDIASKRAAPILARFEALNVLSTFNIEQVRIADIFQEIMLDKNEDFRLRSTAIEWFPRYENMLDTWIEFLADESADVRFWAAYRLAQPWGDTSRALPALDRIAAYDHTLPKSFGWHVDREALSGLEHIYSLPYRRQFEGDSDGDDGIGYPMWLVSPAVEYTDLLQRYRRWNDDHLLEELPLPSFNLYVDPAWLHAKIRQAWTSVTFDARQPKPETYILDWYIQIEGQDLLGGLHRDQYGLVLTGTQYAVYTFAVWYRSIIAPEHKLYIYEWADDSMELTPEITVDEIMQAVIERDKALRAHAL